jgi:CRISPR-associated protein Cas1
MAGPQEADLLPVRMLAEYVYCPRLGYLEYAQGEFVDNAYTLDGTQKHKTVDEETGTLPDADQTLPDLGHPVTSLFLSDTLLGLTTRVDVCKVTDQQVIPIEYKRGKKPDHEPWDDQRIQVCAQALVLRANGYACTHGQIYYIDSHMAVDVPIDADLEHKTIDALRSFLDILQADTPPIPLVDSPRCLSCSLAGICLPDELHALDSGHEDQEIRRIMPARDDALPMYVQDSTLHVTKADDQLIVKTHTGETVGQAHLFETSQLNLFGNPQLTTQALHALMELDIPVCHFSSGGRFLGMTRGFDHKNVELRRAQYRAADNATFCLETAQRIVHAKTANCRTMLRRNADPATIGGVLDELARIPPAIRRALALDELLGVEGSAARLYFANFSSMLRPPEGPVLDFHIEERNRRPPRDPVNAMLSFAYALLTRDATVALFKVGLDPLAGFYHQLKYGKPALALDFMEEFRPLIADSVVITAVNTGVVKSTDFVRSGIRCNLKDTGRIAFIRAYERRMDTLVTHPVFGYKISYRRVLDVQARLLARYVSHEIAEYPEFSTR